MTAKIEREAAIASFAADAEALLRAEGPTPAALEQVRARVAALAARKELFPLEDFRLPTEGKSERFVLYMGEGDRFALYLNTVLPGKSTYPHNHKTWAVVASVQGDERNRIWRRKLDAAGNHVGLELDREVVVAPGQAVLFGPEDIHSVHFEDAAPGVQIHYYGQSLESLTGRSGFHPETGEELNYNKAVMKPTAGKA